MLFLGSKSFPAENDFDKFIRDNSGSFNAYTASDHTLYYVDSLAPSSFYGALDRLSKFFYEPLFSPSSSDRERQAVDQEFRKNIEQVSYSVLRLRTRGGDCMF
jgi:insulysin